MKLVALATMLEKFRQDEEELKSEAISYELVAETQEQKKKLVHI